MSLILSKDTTVAAQLLINGEVIGIPTETVYGLAANAFNKNSVLKIFEVKNRPFFDPLIVHTHSIEKIKEFADDIPGKLMQLMMRFSPGPITILVKKKDIIPDIVTSGLDQVGIRIPNHPLTLSLLRQLDFPLCAPSANPFGFVSPTTAQHVIDQLGDKIPMVLDGGECKVGLESTIVGMEGDRVVLYRLGGLSVEEIENTIGKVEIQINDSSNPKAPGMLSAHYAPTLPLFLGDVPKLYSEFEGKRVGLISLQNEFAHLKFSSKKILSPSGDIAEAAANLFAALRSFSAENTDVILAAYFPDMGLGRAINDRLKRASVKN